MEVAATVSAALAGCCGIRIAASRSLAPATAIAEIKAHLSGCEPQHVIVFFSGAIDPHELAAALGAAFPGVPCSGCSTAGEITPFGMMEAGVMLIAFPRERFHIQAEVIENLSEIGLERAAEVARVMKARALARQAEDNDGRTFALTFVDGLSNAEERLIAVVHWVLDDVELVGGSAGDGLAFTRTSLLHDGRVLSGAAILVLVETNVPFRVFKTQNFEPTQIKLVVTAADPENRIVHELNAEPAALEYAAAIGLMPGDLGPFSFASYPLVVRVGGNYYCRSIRNMNADGSLSFFCAIDEGLVLTVASPRDMLRATAETLQKISADLGGIDVALGFDCVLRRLDAENRQIRHDVERLYGAHNVVGFHTYGEQVNGMHLNQTLTGIAFGRPRS